jgi:DNA-binding protein HU-beta
VLIPGEPRGTLWRNQSHFGSQRSPSFAGLLDAVAYGHHGGRPVKVERNMTKAEFVETLASTLGQTKTESERVLEAVVDVLKQALQRGEKIDLRGLGVFKVREAKPRQARNPRTGETLSIAAKRTAVFKPGKELSTTLNDRAAQPDGGAAQVEESI